MFNKRMLSATLACGAAFAGQKTAKKADIVASIQQSAPLTRSLVYSEKDVPTIRTHMNYTTVVVLPKSEKVMDLLCGHAAEWEINGSAGTNFAYVKPERAGAKTNLNLVTASGNVYSFLLVEGEGQPDLKVFVEAKDTAMLNQMAAPPKWVPMAEFERAQDEAKRARADSARESEQAEAARVKYEKSAEEAIADFRSKFPASLVHDYAFKDRKQFAVQAIAHSKGFTYIWATPQETPALYEVKDGKPALINFAYHDGVYVVPKVLDAGYLAVGKRRMQFKREE